MPRSSININFDGSSEGLVRSLRDASRALGRTNNDLRRTRNSFTQTAGVTNNLTQSLRGLAQVAGVGLGIGGFLALSKNAASFGESLNELSRTLGLTTDELQAMQLAAKLVNVEFPAMQYSMRRLRFATGEAVQGIGEYEIAFNRLGISMEELPFLTTIQLMRRVTREIENNGLVGTAQGTSIIRRLFGETGDVLTPLLGLGVENFDAITRQATDRPIRSDEDLQNLERLNESISELTASFGVLKDDIIADLVPVIAPVIDGLTSLAQAAVDLNTAFTNLDPLTFLQGLSNDLASGLADVFGIEAVADAYRALGADSPFFPGGASVFSPERTLNESQAADDPVTTNAVTESHRARAEYIRSAELSLIQQTVEQQKLARLVNASTRDRIEISLRAQLTEQALVAQAKAQQDYNKALLESNHVEAEAASDRIETLAAVLGTTQDIIDANSDLIDSVANATDEYKELLRTIRNFTSEALQLDIEGLAFGPSASDFEDQGVRVNTLSEAEEELVHAREFAGRIRDFLGLNIAGLALGPTQADIAGVVTYIRDLRREAEERAQALERSARIEDFLGLNIGELSFGPSGSTIAGVDTYIRGIRQEAAERALAIEQQARITDFLGINIDGLALGPSGQELAGVGTYIRSMREEAAERARAIEYSARVTDFLGLDLGTLAFGPTPAETAGVGTYINKLRRAANERAEAVEQQARITDFLGLNIDGLALGPSGQEIAGVDTYIRGIRNEAAERARALEYSARIEDFLGVDLGQLSFGPSGATIAGVDTYINKLRREAADRALAIEYQARITDFLGLNIDGLALGPSPQDLANVGIYVRKLRTEAEEIALELEYSARIEDFMGLDLGQLSFGPSQSTIAGVGSYIRKLRQEATDAALELEHAARIEDFLGLDLGGLQIGPSASDVAGGGRNAVRESARERQTEELEATQQAQSAVRALNDEQDRTINQLLIQIRLREEQQIVGTQARRAHRIETLQIQDAQRLTAQLTSRQIGLENQLEVARAAGNAEQIRAIELQQDATQRELNNIDTLIASRHDYYERVERLQSELEQSQNRSLKRIAEALDDTLNAGLRDALSGTDNLKRAFEELAVSIAEAAIEFAFFGSNGQTPGRSLGEQIVGGLVGSVFDEGFSGIFNSDIPSAEVGTTAAQGGLPGGGGANYVQNFYISNSDETTVRRGLNNALPAIQDATAGRVAQDLTRPSTIRQSATGG